MSLIFPVETHRHRWVHGFGTLYCNGCGSRWGDQQIGLGVSRCPRDEENRPPSVPLSWISPLRASFIKSGRRKMPTR